MTTETERTALEMARSFLASVEMNTDLLERERADVLQAVDAALASAPSAPQSEIERLKKELAEAKFAPLGDNHHNAAACPYCSPKLAQGQERTALIEQLRGVEALALGLHIAASDRGQQRPMTLTELGEVVVTCGTAAVALDALSSSAPVERPQVDWQLRDSAPEDGQPFHAFGPLLIDEDFNPNGVVEATFDGENGYVGAIWNNYQDCWDTQAIEFTHWRPMLKPPLGLPGLPDQPAPSAPSQTPEERPAGETPGFLLRQIAITARRALAYPSKWQDRIADIVRICEDNGVTIDGVLRGRPTPDPIVSAMGEKQEDPIAAAVDAQLDPLKDELIAMGHTLAKEERRDGCTSGYDGWTCTLLAGHKGEHVATNAFELNASGLRGKVYAKWVNEAPR
jgi:hypothetical protein